MRDNTLQDDKQFSTEHLSGDLKRVTVRGGGATLIVQCAKFALNLASTMILARVLTPNDFGLVAMVTAVIGFIMVFKDLGLSMATVQQADINQDQVSTLFWINVVMGALLTVVTAALAPVLAWFYKDARLLPVTVALGLCFLLGGLTVQHQALLRRHMRLSAVAYIDLISAFIGSVTAIVCARIGLGYWSLVWMQIVAALGSAVGVWVVCDWRPSRPVRGARVRSMLAFGGNLTAFTMLSYFSRNLDNILIGKYWGALALGLYSRSYNLLLFPISQITGPITSAAVPALSRLQDDPDRFRRFYLTALKFIAYVSMPITVAIGVLSPEIVFVVLGKEWMDAAPIFRALAVAAFLQPIGSTVGWLFISLGQTRRMFEWSCIATPLTVLSFIVGVHWNALGVAIGYSIYNLIIVVPGFSFAFRHSPIRLADLIAVAYRPMLMSAVMGVAMWFVRSRCIGQGAGAIALVSLTSGILSLGITALISRSVKSDVSGVINHIRTAL